VRARRSRSSRPPRGSGRTQRGESVARALAARRNGLLIRIRRYPKFPFCASELSYDCAKYVDWPRAVYRLQRDGIWPVLVDGPLSLQVRRTANSWGEPNEEWTMNGECGGAGYAPNLRTMGRWALYANCSIARLVRSITVRRLYGKHARVNHDVSQHRQAAPR
jgi:hypothetical protein